MSDKESEGKGTEQPDRSERFEDLFVDEPFGLEESSHFEDGEESFLEVDERQAEEMRQIFGASFPQYLQPVEEVLQQVFSGQGDADSLDTLSGVIDSLLTATQRMNLPSIHTLLIRLSERLGLLDKEFKQPIADEVKKGILDEIQNLKEHALQMAGLDSPITDTQQTTIRSVLKDREGVGELVMKRLNMAGLTTVDQLLMGRPEEVAAVSGLDIEIVRRVIGLLTKEDSKGHPHPTEQVAAHLTQIAEPEADHHHLPDSSPLDSLHETVLTLIQQEARERSGIERLKIEIQELNACISGHRKTLKTLNIGIKEKKKTIKNLSKTVKKQIGLLGELKEQCSEYERKCAALKESVHQKEVRLTMLDKKQKSLEKRSDTINGDVESLVSSLGQINRSFRR